jgi:hypothetical protein
MRSIAGFPQRGNTYFLPRAQEIPDEALCTRIWPEVDVWLERMEAYQPRPNRQRGRTARSRGVGISRSSAGAPIILRTKLSLRTSYTLVAALCFPSSICSSDSSVHLSMRILLLLLTPGGSVLFPHECVLLLFLSTPGGSILLPHECISPLILLMMTATSFLISSLVLPPVGSTCFSSLCLFCAIIMLCISSRLSKRTSTRSR